MTGRNVFWNRIVVAALAVLWLMPEEAQAQKTDALGAYDPYSLFGVGQLSYDGTAYNMSMGGIGLAIRNNGYINYLNPAAITARDTLAFMFDFGINQKNTFYNDNIAKSAYNIANMQNVVMTFPIYKKSAFVVGITPFSDVGYKFQSTENDTDLVAEMGDIKYQRYGTGSIYKVFVGAAAMFFNRISIGAEGIYYFGKINRHSDILFNSSSNYNTIYTGWETQVNGFSGKFGLQYIQPVKKNNSEIVIGGTYRLGTSLDGNINRYAFSSSSSSTDTVVFDSPKINRTLDIADEFGVGISYRVNNHWAVGADYIQQNWHNISFIDFGSKAYSFDPATARYYRAGFEYIPNANDIRYYMKRVTYRGGAYYEQSYVMLNGHQINSFGITLGATFPILMRNAVSFAVNMGQRGTLKYNLVRERYITFTINFNLHDIWFLKYKYD